MLAHWISCPVNGYLGSGYGSELKALIQTPMAAGLADGIIAKARQDIPLLLTAAPDAVNVYAEDRGMDVKAIVFEIGGELVQVDGGTSVSTVFNDAPTVNLDLELIDTVSQTGADLLNFNVNITLPSPGYF